MKEIILTQNQVALANDCDFEKLNQFKWYAHKGRNTFYALRNSPKINGKKHTIFMHHEVIGKPPVGKMLDHEDGNGCNNQRYNLRHVTNRQNSQNRKKIQKTSKYPGVCWYGSQKKWCTKIEINGKTKNLGYFANEANAFGAYKQAVEGLGEKVI